MAEEYSEISVRIPADEEADEEKIDPNIEEDDKLISLRQGKDPVFKHLRTKMKSTKQTTLQWPNKKGLAKIIFHLLLPIMSIFVGTYIYILSLESCTGIEHECVVFLQAKKNFFLQCIALSGFIYATLFNLTIFHILNKKYVIIAMINISFLCFIYDTGNTFASHGGWNRLIFLPLIAIFTFFIFGFVYLCKAIKRIPIILPIILLIIIFIIVILKERMDESCKGWEKGLGGTELDNSEPYCQITIPQFCYFPFMGRILDITYILGTQCGGKKSKEIYDYVPKSTKMIGFPRTEYLLEWERYDHLNESGLFRFQELVLQNLIDLDDKNLTKETIEKTEIKLNIEDRENPKVIIDVKRNETTVNRAKENIKKRELEPIAKNFIGIFIDSVSRAHMHRTMPKVVKWLERFYNNPEAESESYQFFRFHSYRAHTVENLKALYYGVDVDFDYNHPRLMNNPRHIRNEFKDQGYVLGGSYSHCSSEFYEYYAELSRVIPGDKDHEGQPLFCDPSYTDPKDYYSVFKGQNSMFRRCLYGKDGAEYVFEYANKFWNEYKDLPKYLELLFVDAHESTGHVGRYMDDHLANYLDNLEELEDTVIMLLSDHGLVLSTLFYPETPNSDQYLEQLLPALYFLFPKKSLLEAQRKALKENENALLTNFDLHETLNDIVASNKTSIAKVQYSYTVYSILQPIPQNRTGKDVDQKISACPLSTTTTN